MRYLLTLLLVFGLAAQAEPLTLKGFSAGMTKEEFIARGRALDGVVDEKAYDAERQQHVVYLRIYPCKEVEAYDYCPPDEDSLTIGGADIEEVVWTHDEDDGYVSVSFSASEEHQQTLYEAVRLKFGYPDDSELKQRVFLPPIVLLVWNQDINNKMTMPETGQVLTLRRDLIQDADTEDF